MHNLWINYGKLTHFPACWEVDNPKETHKKGQDTHKIKKKHEKILCIFRIQQNMHKICIENKEERRNYVFTMHILCITYPFLCVVGNLPIFFVFFFFLHILCINFAYIQGKLWISYA